MLDLHLAIGPFFNLLAPLLGHFGGHVRGGKIVVVGEFDFCGYSASGKANNQDDGQENGRQCFHSRLLGRLIIG
ncbi:hypothetical protein DESC_700213 [Desulfosarcina cetonica]|nr:hypothetical protein DESC_700213 [Desulfosarcina cetonica]